jgi:hypothetical protein
MSTAGIWLLRDLHGACLSFWEFGLIFETFPGNGAQGELEAMTIRLQNMEEKVSVWYGSVIIVAK